MARERWLTGDTSTAVEYIYRRVRIPNDLPLIMAVNGAILALTKDFNWEKFGSATPEECAALMSDMLYYYFESDVNMLGTVISYATTNPPTGVLECDGATYQRVDYPQLYDALDSVFIVDADNFTVPDLRSRFVVGAGTGSGLSNRAVGATGGEEDHTLTTAEMPSHNHAYHAEYLASRTGAVDLHTFLINDTGISTIDTLDTGGDDSHNNMPPFYGLKYGIIAR